MSTFRLCTDTIKNIKRKSETRNDAVMDYSTLMPSPRKGSFSYHQLSAPFLSFSIATTTFGS